jgi:hypothetical protein
VLSLEVVSSPATDAGPPLFDLEILEIFPTTQSFVLRCKLIRAPEPDILTPNEVPEIVFANLFDPHAPHAMRQTIRLPQLGVRKESIFWDAVKENIPVTDTLAAFKSLPGSLSEFSDIIRHRYTRSDEIDEYEDL